MLKRMTGFIINCKEYCVAAVLCQMPFDLAVQDINVCFSVENI